jgi:chromosome segregation ATPase
VGDWSDILIGLVGGGGFVAVLQRLWPSRAEKTDAADKLRDDMMQLIGALRSRLEGVEKDLDCWKRDYYALRDEKSVLQGKYEVLQVSYNTLDAKYQAVKDELERLRREVASAVKKN